MSIDAIGIVCRDLEKTISFYNILGIEFKKFGDDHYEGETASGLRLMLDSLKLIKELNPAWNEVSGGNVIICFKQDASEDVDKLYEKLIEAGAKSVKSPWDAFWGQRYSSVLDPNGNQIDIFASL